MVPIAFAPHAQSFWPFVVCKESSLSDPTPELIFVPPPNFLLSKGETRVKSPQSWIRLWRASAEDEDMMKVRRAPQQEGAVCCE